MIEYQRNALKLPMKICMMVMVATIVLFLWGPIPWVKQVDIAVVTGIALFILYAFAFMLGYYYRLPRSGERQYVIVDNVNKQMMSMMRYTLFINLILTVANAFIYGGVSSLSQLFNAVIKGLTSPSTVYYGKDVSSRSGNIIVLFTCAYSPILYLTQVYAMLVFKKLNKKQKVCYVVTLVIEIMRWLAVGTNKGLFDIVLLIVYVFCVTQMKYKSKGRLKKAKDRRKQKKMMLFVIIGIILFFLFFSYALSSRVKGEYHQAYFETFPYKWLPDGMKFFLEKFDSYLTQGYANTIKILRNCQFKWTYGAGNSRFLMDTIKRIFKISLEENTYPYQLAKFGVDPLAEWHSAYSWFASDITYVGIIPFMFMVGYFMSSLASEVLLKDDPISLTLLYFVFISIVNISCTNYVLAYRNGFVAFWLLFLLRGIKKHNIRFNGKKIVSL